MIFFSEFFPQLLCVSLKCTLTSNFEIQFYVTIQYLRGKKNLRVTFFYLLSYVCFSQFLMFYLFIYLLFWVRNLICELILSMGRTSLCRYRLGNKITLTTLLSLSTIYFFACYCKHSSPIGHTIFKLLLQF